MSDLLKELMLDYYLAEEALIDFFSDLRITLFGSDIHDKMSAALRKMDYCNNRSWINNQTGGECQKEFSDLKSIYEAIYIKGDGHE